MNRKLPIMLGFAVLLGMMSIPNISAELAYLSEIGSTGIGNDNLNGPTDVILSSNGRTIYVVDSENNRINVFEDDGDYDFKFGSFCSIFAIQNCNDNAVGADNDGDGQFDNPKSATLDLRGNFFVVDADNTRVQRFNDDGRFEIKFGSVDSTTPDYLGSPQGIAVLDSTREIYVSDRVSDSILVFDSSTDFLFAFDSFDGNDDFRNPSYLLIDNLDKMLYVSDSSNNQIVIFKLVDGNTCPSGTDETIDGVCYVERFGTSGSDYGEFNSPAGLALDSTNDLLYVADTNNDRIQVFKLVDGNTCPSGTKEVINGVCFVEEFGSTGSGDGKFDTPLGIALDTTNDLLYVADSENDRIQVISLDIESLSDAPRSPENLHASPISATSVILTWDEPVEKKGISKITGYKIEYKTGSKTYDAISNNTKNTATSFIHNGLTTDIKYTYRVYAINSDGTSVVSSSSTVKPQSTTTPTGVIADAISPSQIRLTWHAPSDTFGQKINGYEINRVVAIGVYDPIGETNSKTTSFVVSNLATDKTYSYVISAKLGFGSTNESPIASATPRKDSIDDSTTASSSTVIVNTVSSAPIKLTATGASSTQINLSWSPPSIDGNSEIIGYKIDVKKDSGSFVILVDDTKSTTRTYQHTNLSSTSNYTYKVYAINSVGTSDASNEITAKPAAKTIQISPMGKLTLDEGKTMSFIVKITGSTVGKIVYSLDGNVPPGATINSSTGMFSWTPTSSQGAKSYTFDLVAKNDSMTDRESLTITVNDTIKIEPKDNTKEPEPKVDANTIASFVDSTKDPQYYIDRYNNEPSYKKWFDENYSEYSSIYDAVGFEKPLEIPAPFVDSTKDPQYYIDRYNNEPSYKKWFDENHSEYTSIYHAVGLEDQKPKKVYGYCGTGTKLIDGVCEIIEVPQQKPWWQFW